jgi:hypothetical protein
MLRITNANGRCFRGAKGDEHKFTASARRQRLTANTLHPSRLSAGSRKCGNKVRRQLALIDGRERSTESPAW